MEPLDQWKVKTWPHFLGKESLWKTGKQLTTQHDYWIFLKVTHGFKIVLSIVVLPSQILYKFH